MILQTNKYVKTMISFNYFLFTSNDITKTITELSASSGVPLLAIVNYSRFLLGNTPELQIISDRLRSFYHYDFIEELTEEVFLECTRATSVDEVKRRYMMETK